jgi:hypothetical protein
MMIAADFQSFGREKGGPVGRPFSFYLNRHPGRSAAEIRDPFLSLSD